MTNLQNKKVKRGVYDPRRGDLVITLAPEGVFMRYKGKRTLYGPISYGLIMLQGEKAMAEQILREKAEKRRLRGLPPLKRNRRR